VYLFWTIAAALAFTLGAVFTKTSEGMTRPAPTLLLFVCFAAGAAAQALAMREAEMGVAYLLSLGLEVVMAFAFAYLFFAESASWCKVLGVAAIVAGMILMHLGSPSSSADASEQPSPVAQASP
jgi:multidrug transporter EmrE-like cation transporter